MPETRRSLFRYFETWPAVIRLTLMLYVQFPPSSEVWRTFSTSAGSR